MNIWSDCKKLPLTEVLSFIVDNRGKTVPTTTSGHILIATNCIKNDRLYPCYEKIRFLSEDTYQSFFRSHPIPGDILFVCKGTPGRCALVPDPIDFCIAQDMVGLRTNKSIIDNKYLLAVLRSYEIQKFIYNTSVGDVIPHFKKQFFNKLLIPVPPMELQTKIGAFYYSISQKIENNNKINANLEAQAEALFKSWFVDFTPFKDQPFVDSELGPIPQGWKVGTLFDVANLHDRYRRPLSSNQRSLMAKKYPYYGATSLMDFVEDYIFDGEYVLMGEDGSVVTEKGYPFIQYVWGKIWVNNHAHVLSGKDGFPTELLIPFLKTYNIKGLVTGAVQAKLNQANMAQIQIPIPPKENINNISVIIKSIYKKYRLLTEENQRLAALRDTLLPKLMSGEIKL